MAKTIVHFGSPQGTSYGETKKIIIVKETRNSVKENKQNG
jgi:hypothetical protein